MMEISVEVVTGKLHLNIMLYQQSHEPLKLAGMGVIWP